MSKVAGHLWPDHPVSRSGKLGIAIDKCQQACLLAVALEQFQGCEDSQQMLLAANGKNDCCFSQRK